MKNTLKNSLILFMMLFETIGSLDLHSQNYEKVLKADSTAWITYHRELEGIMKDLAYVKNINDVNYLYYICGVDFLTESYLIGTLREEDGRLWITYCEDPDNETLLMDMNLEVGDEFVFDEWNNVSAIVNEVKFENGRKTIIFNRTSFKWFGEPFMFIEGMGRNIMGYFQYDDYDQSYQSCKFDEQDLAYSTANTHFSDCEYVTDAVNEYSDEIQKIEVYPNPANKDVTLSYLLEKDANVELIITDMLGNEIRHIHCSKRSKGNHDEIIDISNLTPGIYILKVRTTDGKEYTERIVKE